MNLVLGCLLAVTGVVTVCGSVYSYIKTRNEARDFLRQHFEMQQTFKRVSDIYRMPEGTEEK
jgi:hypothetical protein